MITKAMLYMDYTQAKQRAQELETLADEIKMLASRDITNSLENLSSSWTGDNAALFMSKGEQVRQQISSLAKDLQEVATSIRQTAKTIYDTELRAIEIALNNTSNA